MTTHAATVREPARDVPVACETDVCVVGGSCTGVFAAVRAARLGARVAVIEKQNCFGGMATAGDVNIWHSLNDTRGERPVIGGLTRDMLDRLRKRGAVLEGSSASSAFRLNTEELKIELDQLVTDHRIEPFLHTVYAGAVADGDDLRAVIVQNKSGRQAIRARTFIDATGDGDLARDAGLSFRPADMLQPPTTCAKILGLDALAGFDWTAAVREHGHEFGLGRDWGWGGAIPGLPGLQLRADTHVFGVDASDASQLSRAEIEGRRQVRAIMDVIRKYGPPGAVIGLADLASTIGIRETRRVAARYQLSGEDVLYGRRFPDAIANGSYRVDIHHAHDSGITFRYLDGTEEVIPERGMPARRGRWREALPEDPAFYQVPLRCLVQDRVRNLMLAGRMLDADRLAFSAVRVMVNMNQTGEAAGVVCALACQQGCAVMDVDPQQVRERLAEGGSIIV